MSKTTTPATAAETFNADREHALDYATMIVTTLETFCEGERIDWGHAGTMAHVKAQLADLVDTLLEETE